MGGGGISEYGQLLLKSQPLKELGSATSLTFTPPHSHQRLLPAGSEYPYMRQEPWEGGDGQEPAIAASPLCLLGGHALAKPPYCGHPQKTDKAGS